MVHLFKKIIELVFLVSGLSTVWEDTNSYAKHRCYFAIYLITVLSSLYYIIIYPVINVPGIGENDVDSINTTNKRYLKEQM